MKSDDIRNEIAILQEEKNKITQQIDDAKRIGAIDHVFADREWLSRAEFAARRKGIEIYKLQCKLGNVLKDERKETRIKYEKQQPSFERIFIRKSRDILPKDVYEHIMSETMHDLEKMNSLESEN